MSEMRQVALGDILTKEQIEELRKYVNSQLKKGLKPLDTEFTNGLKVLFNQWKDDLLSKEVLPDYLAYVVAYMISRRGGL